MRSHPLRDDQVVAGGLGTVYMEAPSSDGERGRKAGPLEMNAEKMAFTYSSQLPSGETSVKTVGCVLVDVRPDSIRTRLVYLDDSRNVQVADDHAVATLPHDAPRPGLPARRPAAETGMPAPSGASATPAP